MKRLAFALLLSLASLSAAAADNVYDLSFTDLHGKKAVPLSEYRGKVLLLNFWATWCPPCLRELPSMTRLQQRFAGTDLRVVAVNVGQSAAAVEHFSASLDPTPAFRILLDTSATAFQDLGIPGLPMSLLYDRNGRLVATITGGQDWLSKTRTDQIRALLH